MTERKSRHVDLGSDLRGFYIKLFLGFFAIKRKRDGKGFEVGVVNQERLIRMVEKSIDDIRYGPRVSSSHQRGLVEVREKGKWWRDVIDTLKETKLKRDGFPLSGCI